MDLYKLKWKMAFRVKKLKGFFKLCEYNFRHKFNLEGDDQFYYHLQRQLMKDLVKANPEQEYLEEHGLLPEEPESEPEPEPEKEPGLIRELGFGQLLLTRVIVGKTVYIMAEVKEYEDRIYLKVSKAVDWEVEDVELTLPPQAEERYIDFELDGLQMRFDSQEMTMYIPEN